MSIWLLAFMSASAKLKVALIIGAWRLLCQATWGDTRLQFVDFAVHLASFGLIPLGLCGALIPSLANAALIFIRFVSGAAAASSFG